MTRARCLLTTAALLLIFAVEASAQRQGFVINSPRRMGMGGAGVALSGPDNAVFLNPALLSTTTRSSFTLLEAQVLINQNTFEQFGFYQDHKEQFSSLDDMSALERSRFYTELLDVTRDQTVFGLEGMVPVSIVEPGFSVGIYESAQLDYDLSEGASALPVVRADGVAEGEVVVGLGRYFMDLVGRPLHVGLNAKYLYRVVAQESRTAPALETIDVNVFRGSALAFDLGLLVDFGRLSAGLGAYDINWPHIDWDGGDDVAPGMTTPDGSISPSMRVGLAYYSLWGLRDFFEDVKFAFDIESPFSDDMGFFKKLSLGMESRFVRVITLRTGLHQGYPSAGVRIGVSVLKLEYAFSGEALGRHPGQLDSWNHVFSLGLGWGN